MGKLYLLLITLLIWGCEQTFDNVIDTSSENYQLTSVYGIKDTVDLKVYGDSLFSPRLVFSSQSKINKVYFDLYASDNTLLNSSPVQMHEISSNTYEGTYVLHWQYPIGNYNVKFFVTGFDGTIKQIAASSFYFNNGQDNLPPVISNLVIPDTISKGVYFNFSVMVTDANGLNDIKKEDGVFFNLYRPDTTLVQAGPFYMHDDGDAGFGDEVAGDGIFSFRNSFLQDTTTQVGNWKFVFQARDRSGLMSNIIEHYLYVQ